MVNPCCGVIRLQHATKIVSIIDAVGAMFGAFTSIVVLCGLIFFREELEDELYRDAGEVSNYELKRFMQLPVTMQYSMLVFSMLICMLEVVIAVILFQGSWKRNATRCLLWFRIHCVLLVIGIIFTIVTLIISQERIILSATCILGLIYQAYSLWIVRAFVQELHTHKFRSDDDEQGQPLHEIQQ